MTAAPMPADPGGVERASGGRRAAFDYWLAAYRRTWRGSVVSSVISPVLFLAAMGVGLGSLINQGTGEIGGVKYAVYLAPGLLAAAVMQTAQGEATWPVMGAIKWQRTYLGMLATPLTVTDVLLGHLAFMTLRCLMTSAAFTVVTALFGLVQSPGGAVLAMIAGVLLGLAFAAPVTAYSATQQRETGFILLYRFGVVPMFLFSGTFFPISQLPAVLQPIAWVTPLWHGVSLCRGLALGGANGWALLGHTAYLAAMAVAGVLWARRSFARRLKW